MLFIYLLVAQFLHYIDFLFVDQGSPQLPLSQLSLAIQLLT